MKNAFLICLLSCLVMSASWSQVIRIPELGSVAPSFIAASTNGDINFPNDFGKNWKILFSHPKDFTPVCSSEVLELAYEQKNFDEMNAKLIVVSTDLLDLHRSWKTALEGLQYKGRSPVKIEFPIVSDDGLHVAKLYGMLQSSSSTTNNIRGVYFIDPDNIIRAIFFYPNEVGRNIEEVKRTLLALETTYSNKDVVTPVNWEHGDDVMVPVISQEERGNLGKDGSSLYQLSWFMVFKPFH